MRTLSQEVRYPIDAPSTDFASPHTKANLLLQAHIGRLALPCTDYESDAKTVLEHSDRILKALVEIADLWKWYQTAMNVMYLTQAVVQAQWSSENSLLTLPNVFQSVLPFFVWHRRGSDECDESLVKEEIKTVRELVSVCSGDKSVLNAMLKERLSKKQVDEMWNVVEKLPVVQVDLELRPQSQDASTDDVQPEADLLQRMPDRDGVETHYADVLPTQEYGLDVILTTVRQGENNMAHAPRYPKRRNVGWWVMMGDNATNRLLALKKVEQARGTGKFRLSVKTPATAGLTVCHLLLVSDSYLGLDQYLSVCLNVQDLTGDQL
ncbi:activating signal cointegrator 1 complex subunit 3-like [Diadema antillarum]|uniref:activating signal cointegrator 1 complex subunit 3-like n=1 Tax=Diadema antillarum TaxID=105358 RepID=UPI003A8973C6